MVSVLTFQESSISIYIHVFFYLWNGEGSILKSTPRKFWCSILAIFVIDVTVTVSVSQLCVIIIGQKVLCFWFPNSQSRDCKENRVPDGTSVLMEFINALGSVKGYFGQTYNNSLFQIIHIKILVEDFDKVQSVVYIKKYLK